MQSLISFQNIKKQFGQAVVLEEIDFQINQGEIFGLLGPNGAGKTTLMRCLVKLLRPASGKILFRENLLHEEDIQQYFGFLPENFLPPANLTAREFLEILCRGLNLKCSRVIFLLELTGLKNQEKKPLRTYSRGMIQRLGLALALLKDPQVLILDEPTLGLDPLGQRDILKLFLWLNSQGKTIFFSSHLLSQIEKVCGRIGIIHQGRLRFVGSIKELITRHHQKSLEEAFLQEVEEK